MSSRLLLASLGSLLALALCGCKSDAPPTAKAAPLPVETAAVSRRDEPHWIEMLGRAEGRLQVEVRPQVSGIVQKLNYQEGDYVKAGDILFEIDPAPFKAKLASAASLRRQYGDELVQAERELKRTEALYKSGAASRKDYDDAKSERNQKKFQFEQAKADEEEARISLDWTKVRAPNSGYASRAEINPGALVAESTSLLATITQLDDVRVTFAPSDRDLANQKITLKNAVRLFRKDGAEIPAKLDYVAQQIDPDVGTRLMRAKPEGGSSIMPGEFVRVRLMVSVDKNAFRVPQKAVLQRPDGSYAVFVYQDGKAVRKTIEVGLWEGRDWVVRSGLEDGDQVILNQLLRLQDDSPVVLAEPKAAGQAQSES